TGRPRSGVRLRLPFQVSAYLTCQSVYCWINLTLPPLWAFDLSRYNRLGRTQDHMPINFSTSNQTFRQIFGNGLTYNIPRFQCDYSWDSDDWDDLWQDIRNIISPDCEPAHYMGYLVLQTKDNKNFEVIDGQQRLTTLSLLVLSVL